MTEQRHVGREVLPIPDRPYIGHVTYDAKDPDTSFPPIEPLLPPEGAPNVLIVLLDDVGFGAASAFGGPGEHADRRAVAARRVCRTTGSTPLRCVRRLGPRCSADATTTRSAWA